MYTKKHCDVYYFDLCIAWRAIKRGTELKCTRKEGWKPFLHLLPRAFIYSPTLTFHAILWICARLILNSLFPRFKIVPSKLTCSAMFKTFRSRITKQYMIFLHLSLVCSLLIKSVIVLMKVCIKDLQQCIISAVLAFQSCQQMAKNQWTSIVAREYELIKFFFFTGTVLFRVNTVTGGLSDRPLRRAGRGREKIWSPFKIMSQNLNFEFLISEMNRLLNH